MNMTCSRTAGQHAIWALLGLAPDSTTNLTHVSQEEMDLTSAATASPMNPSHMILMHTIGPSSLAVNFCAWLSGHEHAAVPNLSCSAPSSASDVTNGSITDPLLEIPDMLALFRTAAASQARTEARM